MHRPYLNNQRTIHSPQRSPLGDTRTSRASGVDRDTTGRRNRPILRWVASLSAGAALLVAFAHPASAQQAYESQRQPAYETQPDVVPDIDTPGVPDPSLRQDVLESQDRTATPETDVVQDVDQLDTPTASDVDVVQDLDEMDVEAETLNPGVRGAGTRPTSPRTPLPYESDRRPAYETQPDVVPEVGTPGVPDTNLRRRVTGSAEEARTPQTRANNNGVVGEDRAELFDPDPYLVRDLRVLNTQLRNTQRSIGALRTTEENNTTGRFSNRVRVAQRNLQRLGATTNRIDQRLRQLEKNYRAADISEAVQQTRAMRQTLNVVRDDVNRLSQSLSAVQSPQELNRINPRMQGTDVGGQLTRQLRRLQVDPPARQ